MFEPLPIVCQRLNFFGACHKAAHQFAVDATRRFCQAVMHPQPFLSAENQSSLPEIRQMAGNCGLRQVKGLMEMANADLPFGQQVKQP